MVLGLAINYIGKWVGVAQPLNTPVILIVFWFLVIVVAGINKQRIYNWVKSWHKIHPSAYFLMLLPIMAIIGAEIVNYANSNIILMVLLPLIVLVPIMCLTKKIPQNYWGFAIWMMALAILLHRALISPNLSGSDNILELSCFRATYLGQSFPQANAIGSFYGTYNTVLSVTILPAMIERITAINGVWIFKLVYPLLLSIVPVAVYELIKGQFNAKFALLSAFLVMSVYTFYTEILITDKTLIATILFAVFLLMYFTKQKWYFLILVGIGVILSHYATAILFVVLMVGMAFVSRKKSDIVMSLIFIVVGLGWYLTQGNGASANHLSDIGKSLISANTGIISSSGTINEVVRLFTSGVSYLPFSTLILYVISQILIFLGFLYICWRLFIKRIKDVQLEYLALSLMLLILLALELIPRFSSLIGLDRIYLYCMMALAPFIFVALSKIKGWVVISLILVGLFFLANVGFINQIIGHPLSDSIALDYQGSDYPVFTNQEIKGAEWLIANHNAEVYTDAYSQLVFYYIDSSTNIKDNLTDNLMLFKLIPNPVIVNQIPVGSYIYLRKYNFNHNELTLVYYDFNVEDITEYPINELGSFAQVVNSAKLVYRDSDCEIIQTTTNYGGLK
jgi:uncharacterized membrane protein